MSMGKRCPHCGWTSSVGADLCECGYSFATNTGGGSLIVARPPSKFKGYALIATVCAGLLYGFTLINHTSPRNTPAPPPTPAAAAVDTYSSACAATPCEKAARKLVASGLINGLRCDADGAALNVGEPFLSSEFAVKEEIASFTYQYCFHTAPAPYTAVVFFDHSSEKVVGSWSRESGLDMK